MAQRNENETSPGEGPQTPPAVVVEVPVAAPEPENESAEPSADDDADDDAEIVADVTERLAAVETRLHERAQWQTETQSTITSLRQEIADLKATLRTVGQNLPEEVASLRDELTRLSQELQAAHEAPETEEVDPPPVPPDQMNPSGEGEEGPGLTENRPGQSPKRKKRVV